MSTSDKLTYLNETKNKLKEAINLTNANITNDTFRSYEYKLKKGIINTLNNPKAVWDNFEKVESAETAGSITLDPTEYAPMELSLKGNIEQDSTTGKQLIDINSSSFNTQTINGVTITNNGDGSFKLNGTVTGDNLSMRVSSATPSIINSGTRYYLKKNTLSGSYSGGTFSLIVYASLDGGSSTSLINLGEPEQGSFTPNDSYNSIWLWLYASTGRTFNNLIIKPIISTLDDTEWEKYTGNAPSPNPSYPQDIHIVSGDNEIKVQNKNLFDKGTITTINNGTITNDIITSNPISSNYGGVSANISPLTLRAGTYYVRVKLKRDSGTSGNNLTRITLVGIDTSQITMIDNPTITNEYQIYSCRISPTTQITLTNIGIQLQPTNTNAVMSYTDIMVSTSPSTYIEHQEYTKEINLGDLEVGGIGGYEDEFFKNTTDSEYYDSSLELDKWYLKKRIGKVVLDGSETNWAKSSTYQGSFYAGVLIKPGVIRSVFYCNYFTRANIDIGSPITGNYKRGTSFIETTQMMDFWFDDGTATLEDWKNWLSTHNTIVYYVLATPENILLNDTLQETLDSFYSMQGQTNISQTNNDLPFVIKARAIKEIAETVD